MSNVLKAMRLNHYILKANYKTFLFIYVLAIFMSFFRQPALTIVIVMIFSAAFGGTIFSVAEKNNLSKLYGSLPLGKFEVVMGRYLYALLFGIINEIVAGFLAYTTSHIANKSIGQLEFSAYLSMFFLYFCLSIGISFPIYFKFGFSKAYIFTMMPLYVVAIIGIFIGRKVNSLTIKQIIQYLTSNPAAIWVAGIGSGLILLVISCYLSCLINRKTEL